MDFKDIFKKFWFVMLIGLVFLVYIIVLTVQTIQAQPYEVSGLEKDGQSVIYSVDDTNYWYADDLYDELYTNYGQNDIWTSFYKSVVRNGVETTDTLNEYASYLASSYLSYYGSEQLDTQLKSIGYEGVDDLTTYLLDQAKTTELLSAYLTANYDKYVAPVVESNQPKKISQILISVADVTETENEDGTTTHTANPTAEEQQKLDDVLAALANGDDFAEVANTYSDDSQTAANGGLLGIVSTESASNYVTEFKDECLAIQPGETSEVITTQYGYHIIKAEEPTTEELTSDTTFISEISSVYSDVQLRAIMEKADELGYVIYDEDLKSAIDTELSGSEE